MTQYITALRAHVFANVAFAGKKFTQLFDPALSSLLNLGIHLPNI
ncbi:hypothetical protein yrohd0001_27180 [Yersinia rohdei ATCC 43380]|nr:hypothetical protein yrohd0001_27180 [Yersinia rohdei ATCC 43380]